MLKVRIGAAGEFRSEFYGQLVCIAIAFQPPPLLTNVSVKTVNGFVPPEPSSGDSTR